MKIRSSRVLPLGLLYATLIKIERVHLRRLSKEATWIIVGQAAAVVAALVGVRVLTALLRPTQYGELALGLTLATLVNQVIMAPLAAGFSRFYAAASESQDLYNYLKAFRRLMTGATAAVVTLGALFTFGLLLFGYTQWLGLALASFVLSLFNGYSSIFNGVQVAARQRAVVALHQGMDACLRFLLAAGLILWLGNSSAVAMLGYVIGSLLVLSSQSFFFRYLVSPLLTATEGVEVWSKRIWTYSWPFAAWGIFTWAQQASDRWALAVFTTPHDVGLYAVLFQLSYYPVALSTGMAFQLLSTILFQRAGDATDAGRKAHADLLARQITWFVLAITALAFVAALLLHDQVFAIFVGSRFRDVSYLLPWALVTAGFFSAGQSIALRFMTQLRSRMLIPVNIGMAVIGVAANFAGAYLAGINGVVLGSLSVAAIYFVVLRLLAANTG